MRRRAAAAACLALFITAAAAGCAYDGLSGILDAAGEAYDKYGRPSVDISDGDAFYAWRHDLHHEGWAGVPYIDPGVSDIAYQDGPVFEIDPWDRVSVSGDVATDPGMLFIMGPDVDDAGRPAGLLQAEYPGICPGGFLYRDISLPGGGHIAGTAYLFENLRCIRGMADRWLEGCPGSGLYIKCRLFYSGTCLVPEGMLVQAADESGTVLASRYFWNVQPGIAIDYHDGRSWVEAAGDPEAALDDMDVTIE